MIDSENPLVIIDALADIAILQFFTLNREMGLETPWYERLIESLTETWSANLIVGVVAGFVTVGIWRGSKKRHLCSQVCKSHWFSISSIGQRLIKFLRWRSNV